MDPAPFRFLTCPFPCTLRTTESGFAPMLTPTHFNLLTSFPRQFPLASLASHTLDPGGDHPAECFLGSTLHPLSWHSTRSLTRPPSLRLCLAHRTVYVPQLPAINSHVILHLIATVAWCGVPLWISHWRLWTSTQFLHYTIFTSSGLLTCRSFFLPCHEPEPVGSNWICRPFPVCETAFIWHSKMKRKKNNNNRYLINLNWFNFWIVFRWYWASFFNIKFFPL